MDRTSYTLRTPIPFGSLTITELSLRRPMAKDMRSLPADGLRTVDDMLLLVGRLSGQPPVVIDELSLEDLAGVSAIVAGFTQSGPATGDEPSPS